MCNLTDAIRDHKIVLGQASLEELNHKLEECVKAEDYEEAAKIRDLIKNWKVRKHNLENTTKSPV